MNPLHVTVEEFLQVYKERNLCSKYGEPEGMRDDISANGGFQIYEQSAKH